MKQIDSLLAKYGESHLNTTNKLIHWVCVPAIMFSLLTMLFAIPFVVEKTWYANWAMVMLIVAWVYYARLSTTMLFGFLVIGCLMLCGIVGLYKAVDYNSGNLALCALVIFVLAWIGQFIGHKIEGKKPSFLEDIQFLLIGPAWLMHFIFKKIGITY
ncbi:MAG TPA: Mpo1-like protein [Saprospiraceae bacterium]|nr:Mpo1-like protein [Saprospiraceae bacterium]